MEVLDFKVSPHFPSGIYFCHSGLPALNDQNPTPPLL